MQNSGRTAMITDCGVTPQAQNTGISSSPIGTAIAPVGLGDVLDADHVRLAEMHRRAVHGRKSRRDLHGADGVGGRHRPHRHHQRPAERAGRRRRNRRAVHRHGAIAGHVAQLDAAFEQRLFEGKRAADGEGDEIVAPPAHQVARLVDHRAVAPDPVARQVGADIEVLGQGRQPPIARRADADQRTRLWIELAEAQKILGQRARQDGEIGLHETRRQPRGRPGMGIAPNGMARRDPGLGRLGVIVSHRGQRHGALLFDPGMLIAHFITKAARKHTAARPDGRRDDVTRGRRGIAAAANLRKRLKLNPISRLLMGQIPRQEPAKGRQGEGNGRRSRFRRRGPRLTRDELFFEHRNSSGRTFDG